MKYSSTWWVDSSPQILLRDSTAWRSKGQPKSKDQRKGSANSWRPVDVSYLVTNDGLFYRGEVLERGEKDVTPLRTSHVFDEAAELFAQGDQDFILILNRLCRMFSDSSKRMTRTRRGNVRKRRGN